MEEAPHPMTSKVSQRPQRSSQPHKALKNVPSVSVFVSLVGVWVDGI